MSYTSQVDGNLLNAEESKRWLCLYYLCPLGKSPNSSSCLSWSVKWT